MNSKFPWVVAKTVLDFPRREQWLASIDKVHLSSVLITSAVGWIRLHLPLRTQSLFGGQSRTELPACCVYGSKTKVQIGDLSQVRVSLTACALLHIKCSCIKKVAWQKNKSWCFRVKGKAWCLTRSSNMPPRLPDQNLGWKQKTPKPQWRQYDV